MPFDWKPAIRAAELRRRAKLAADRARRMGKGVSPVNPSGRSIAATFWGKAWCRNLERYSDFSNRLPRGRGYVRAGAVLDLRIGTGEIAARVVGSAIYDTRVTVTALPEARWKALAVDCAGSIDSLVELMQGRLSTHVMERICREGTGLFPGPKEITFACSCPDWASMCKHVAAVLYGVGMRLDKSPELLFTLRAVDPAGLIAGVGQDLQLGKKTPGSKRVLDGAKVAELFGIEMAEAIPAGKGVRKAAGKGRKKAVGRGRA